MINAPIFDLSGEIEAPWIDSNNEIIINNAVNIESLNINMQANNSTTTTTATTTAIVDVHEVDSQPPGKKMKMIQKTRSFMHDGYQQVETYNELVPCNDEEEEEIESKTQTAEITKPGPVATQTQAQPKSKQSSMMNFFKKK